MANLRDIRNRIESVKNTKQITKAMKMVAAAKLRKAQEKIEQTRPYSLKMKEVVARMVNNATESHDLLRQPEKTETVLIIVVSSDRGLCGAFNSNLFKVVENTIEKDYQHYKEQDDLALICIGRQAIRHFSKREYNIIEKYPDFFDSLEFSQATAMMKGIIEDFKSGAFDEVNLAYNEFQSVIIQNRIVESVLPIDSATLTGDDGHASSDKEYIFEPGVDKILEKLLPLHLNLQLWKAILDSNAAEQGARMTAMDNATENANEMQDDLELEYNRARQSAITTEISEIVSGAKALQES